MLYEYLAIACLAVQLSVAAPSDRGEGAVQPCHGNIATTIPTPTQNIAKSETIVKPKYSKQHDDTHMFSLNLTEIITAIEENTNIATSIAAQAGKLGDSKDIFQKVMNSTEDQQESIYMSVHELSNSYRYWGLFGEQIIDTFELLSHGVEGELDILRYKKDVINADDDCEELVSSIQYVFEAYLRYNTALTNSLVDYTQKQKLHDLVKDPTTNLNELVDALTCKRSNSKLQSALKSSWTIVVDLL